MAVAYMLDCSQPVTPAYLANLRATFPGLLVISRCLFGGATDPNGNVPSPIGTPVTAPEVATILAAGYGFLPYANNYGYGDLTGDASVGQRKVAEIVAAMDALGAPTGCYFAHDWENWTASAAFMQGALEAASATAFAGSGIVYGSLDGAWRSTLTALQGAGNAAANRAVQWLADYPSPQWAQGQALPDLPNWAGASTWGWQFCGSATVNGMSADLSAVRLPILAVGSEGLWLPGGNVGSPVATAA